MNPGIVLISLTMTSSSGVTKKSTRASPSAPTASNARTARSRTPRHGRREVGGDVEPGRGLVEVLRLEVVELLDAWSTTISPGREARGRRVAAAAEDGALDLATLDALLDEHLRVVHRRVLDRRARGPRGRRPW